MTKKKNEKPVPSFDVALAAFVASCVANKVIARTKKEEPQNKAKEFNAFSPEPEDAPFEQAQSFIAENCPYLQPENNDQMKYYITQSLNIGRYPHNDIQITRPDVSRMHCRIFIKEGRYYVVDLGASKKATLNGVAVDNAHPTSPDLHEFFDHELTEGSVLTVGSYKFTFHKNPTEDDFFTNTMSQADSTILVD